MVPFNRGIATPVCALARNDSIYSTNTNLPKSPQKKWLSYDSHFGLFDQAFSRARVRVVRSQTSLGPKYWMAPG